MAYKSISIFVAGATNLRIEREALKSIANDLNGEFEHRGVKVIIRSYENFNESQTEYDEFISNKTDLMIFILDGRIGEKTRDEFILAWRQQNKGGRPRIMVFLKEYDGINADISYILGLLASTTAEYSIMYHDLDNLRFEAEKRIRRFIESRIKDSTQKKSGGTAGDEPERPAPQSRKSRRKELAAFLLVFILGGLLAYTLSERSDSASKDPLLVIAGGGSAMNYINSTNPEIDINNYYESIYLRLPSGNAWFLLTEEVSSPVKNGNRRYYPVCVSAEEATDSSFLNNIVSIPAFTEHASVIAVYLGLDTLSVYAKSCPAIHQVLSHPDIITTTELASIIRDADKRNINIFSTSPKSGTHNAFVRAVKPFGVNLTDVANNYSENSDLPTINRDGKPYLLLGSKNYIVKRLQNSIESGSTLALTVCDDKPGDMKPLTKPVYLYCLAYVVKNNELEIPRPTMRLLESLNVDTSGKVKNRRIQRPYNDRVIINLKDFPNYAD